MSFLELENPTLMTSQPQLSSHTSVSLKPTARSSSCHSSPFLALPASFTPGFSSRSLQPLFARTLTTRPAVSSCQGELNQGSPQKLSKIAIPTKLYLVWPLFSWASLLISEIFRKIGKSVQPVRKFIGNRNRDLIPWERDFRNSETWMSAKICRTKCENFGRQKFPISENRLHTRFSCCTGLFLGPIFRKLRFTQPPGVSLWITLDQPTSSGGKLSNHDILS